MCHLEEVMDRTAHFYSQPTYVQRGAGLPVYSGSRRQRGGSILGALKGFIMPFLGGVKNRALKRAKSEAFGLVKDVALDAMSGKNVGQSLKTRGLQRAKRLGKGVVKDTAGAIIGPATRQPVSRKRAAKNTHPQKNKRVRNF